MTRAIIQPDGFEFGPAKVTALAAIERRPGTGRSVVIEVRTKAGRTLEIYVSPTGRSVRVFQGTQELT